MFRLPEEVIQDMAGYARSLKDAVEGKMSPTRFRGVRVPWGIYSQRGGSTCMTRVRIPSGLLSAAQLKALAHVSRTYGDGVLHLTTRQDIQVHAVKIEDTLVIMEYLKDFDLSPRGGGGNTVRNVIACSLSGVCADEVFDVKGHAIALTECLLRQEASVNLPRKFKIAFSGCSRDCTGCLVNDIGFLAAVRDGQKGFRVFAAGGMGANPRVGRLLEEFIPESETGYCAVAVRNVFYKNGDRRNRHHNRLRFLVEDIGFDRFKDLYREELASLREDEHIVLRSIVPAEREEAGGKVPGEDDPEYAKFLRYSIRPQKQPGYVSVELRIPRGDITAGQAEALAELAADLAGAEFRTSQNQDLVMCWIRNVDLYRLFGALKEILDGFLCPGTLLDVVACKGALTCNLGLCNSPALACEIERVVGEELAGTRVFKELDVKINGCPNACGHHPVGALALHGLVRRVDGRPVPFYKFLVGGRKGAEATRLAQEVGMVPGRNVPVFLSDLVRELEGELREGEDMHEFLAGRGKDIARRVLERHSYVPSHAENRDFYVDWGRDEEFSLAGIGPGECGAGVLDIIEADLADAGLALEEAGRSGSGADAIRKALASSARALLVVRGAEPRTGEDALALFKEKFIDSGIALERFAGIEGVFEGLAQELSAEKGEQALAYAKEFLEHIRELYSRMDSSFNFPPREAGLPSQEGGLPAKEGEPAALGAGSAPSAGPTPGGPSPEVLDLKGTLCPMNYVKTKLVLEELESGTVLQVLLDEGEPVRNVPRSLKDDGHEVLGIEKQDSHYVVTVKKK